MFDFYNPRMPADRLITIPHTPKLNELMSERYTLGRRLKTEEATEEMRERYEQLLREIGAIERLTHLY